MTSLTHLEQLARSAAQGPWTHVGVRHVQHEIFTADDTDADGEASISCWHAADAAFIAACDPTTVLKLLADRRELVVALNRALRLADNIGSVIDGSKTERIHKELRELEDLAAKHEVKP